MSDKPDFTNLYRGYQIQAAESVLDPNEVYYYRKICRWYSETFHTPLHEVHKLPADTVLTNYYESIMEKIPHNDLYDQVKVDFLPDLVAKDEEDNEAYAQALEAEQQLTMARNIAKKLKNQQNPQSLTQENPPAQPADVSLKFDDPQEP